MAPFSPGQKDAIICAGRVHAVAQVPCLGLRRLRRLPLCGGGRRIGLPSWTLGPPPGPQLGLAGEDCVGPSHLGDPSRSLVTLVRCSCASYGAAITHYSRTEDGTAQAQYKPTVLECRV